MIKKIWKVPPIEWVVGVIVAICIVAFIAHSVVVSNSPVNKGPCCGNYAVASTVPTPFTNPFDGPTNGTHTANRGGWSVRTMAISGAPLWSEISVQITKDSLPIYKMTGVKPLTADIWMSNKTTSPILWYLQKGPGMSLTNNVSYIENGTRKPVSSDTVLTDDFYTIQGAAFVVVDTDGRNTMNAGDLVLIYASNNADTIIDIGGIGWQIEFTMGGTTICSSPLS